MGVRSVWLKLGDAKSKNAASINGTAKCVLSQVMEMQRCGRASIKTDSSLQFSFEEFDKTWICKCRRGQNIRENGHVDLC